MGYEVRGLPATWPARYDLLDGLRGLACLGVVLHHLGVAAIGHYCVMVFFVISGYCITAAVNKSLAAGASFGAFMARRIRRIYPPYLIAVLLFALTRLLKERLDDSFDWSPGSVAWLQNLTLTQWLSLPFHPIAWPSDNPVSFVAAFWSLNYEEQFYLVMGVLMVAVRSAGLRLWNGVLLLALAGLLWNGVSPGGWVTGFFLEYWLHFACGCAVCFVLCEAGLQQARSLLPWVAAAAAVACALVLWFQWGSRGGEQGLRVYAELTVIACVVAGLVWIRPIADRISDSIAWRPFAAIGTISYSLYLIHQFNLTLVSRAAASLLPADPPAALSVVAQLALHLVLAAGFWWLFERPFLPRRDLPGHQSREHDAKKWQPLEDNA